MAHPPLGNNGCYDLLGSVPLRDQVAEALTDMIVDGSWAAGDYLPSQTQLAETFSVSVPVIREALQILKARGLVSVAHGKGVKVLPPSLSHASTALGLLAKRKLATISDLIELRFMLEPDIAALAAQRATEEQIQALEALIAPTFKDELVLEEWLQAEIGFHKGLAEATGNALCPLFMEVFTGLFQRFLRISLSRKRSDGPAEHKAILEAIRARDPQAAREAMLAQLRNNRRDLLALEIELEIEPELDREKAN